MKFYIVTPTFNVRDWLPSCLRSVADQAGNGIEVHHHIQDGGSVDGTKELLQEWQETHADVPGYTFTYESGKDNGMYDAINKAWAQMPADADVTAHLNGDEQYLPHALQAVAEAFAAHPESDIVSTGFFVLDEKGRYVCHRRPMVPDRRTSCLRCALITCSCFHKAEPFRRHGIRFDTSYRIAGDFVLFHDILCKARPRVYLHHRAITSAFFVTGQNLGWDERINAEINRFTQGVPRWLLRLKGLICKGFTAMMWLADIRCPAPKEYALYYGGAEQRETRPIRRPRIIWQDRREGEDA